eukprot:3604066-Pleurochrysis_carterae.AAC.2
MRKASDARKERRMLCPGSYAAPSAMSRRQRGATAADTMGAPRRCDSYTPSSYALTTFQVSAIHA